MLHSCTRTILVCINLRALTSPNLVEYSDSSLVLRLRRPMLGAPDKQDKHHIMAHIHTYLHADSTYNKYMYIVLLPIQFFPSIMNPQNIMPNLY